MSDSSPNIPSHPRRVITLIGMALWAFWAIGMVYPDIWWGTHYLAFLPGAWGQGLLLLSGILILSTFWRENPLQKLVQLKILNGWIYALVVIGIAVLAGILFHSFPIIDDYYGDAFRYERALNEQVTELPAGLVQSIFTLDFWAGRGRIGVNRIITVVAYTFGLSIKEGFWWLDTFCGIGYVITWLSFIRNFLKTPAQRWIMALLILTAPMLQIYFGHIESYAPVFWVMSGCLMLMMWVLVKPTTLKWGGLVLLLLIGIRLHPLILLLVPVTGVVAVFAHFRDHPFTQKIQSPTGILATFLAPIWGIGLLVYFFVLQDHVDPRTMDPGIKPLERLFLPLLSPEAPLDRYNLLSGNHLFDYFQMILFWTPAGLLVLGGGLWLKQSIVKWTDSGVLVLFATICLYASALFMINPLVSMPMDWDLFCLVAPCLLMLIAVMVRGLDMDNLAGQMLPAVIGLGLFSVSVFTVNGSRMPYSARLESVGIRVFRTYYVHSDNYLLYAWARIPNDFDLYLSRQKETLQKLKPAAIPGNDLKYATLLTDHALVLMRGKKDLSGALQAFSEAQRYAPLPPGVQTARMECFFLLGDYQSAFLSSLELIRIGHPSPPQALRMGIHTALEAGRYDAALEFSRQYLSLQPEDRQMQLIRDRLERGEAVEELKLLFRQEPEV